MTGFRLWWSRREPLLLAAVFWVCIAGVVLPTAWTLADDVGACDTSILELEVAGSADRLDDLLATCPAGDEASGRFDGIHRGLFWDSWLLVPTYVVLLALPAVVAHHHAAPRGKTGRGLLRLGVCAAVVAGVLDLVENQALHWALDDPESKTWPVVTFAAAVPKLALLLFAGVVALSAGRRISQGLVHPPSEADLTYWQPTGDSAQDRAFDIPGRPADGALGIACSGGGIRSASFCMGAMQTFAEHTWPRTGSTIVGSADSITSVSGGGYFAGARQLLLRQGVPQPFLAGSHEEDHVRRHGRYLADSAGEWLAAVARIIAGLVLNLGLIVLLLYLLARPAGWAQEQLVPCVPPTAAEVRAGGLEGACVPGEYVIGPGSWAAVALPAALGLVLVVGFVLRRERSNTGDPFSAGDLVLRCAAVSAIAAIGAALVTLLVPAVSFGLRWALRLGDTDQLTEQGGAAAATSTILALLGTGLRVLLGRGRALHKAIAGKGADGAKAAGPPKVGRLLQGLAGVALAVCALLLFAGFVEGALDGPSADAAFGLSDLELWGALGGALLLLYLLADQTTWSLHPLYRRRLATAFALQPVYSEDPPAPDQPRTITGYTELPYATPTVLSECAAPVAGQPKLVVCAAANLSGAEVAPPGRRAVTFTFEHDWVGSPQLGYVGTLDYERSLPPSIKADTTLLTAVAISGAAVASAMGRHSKGALQSLLAVLNVRLGVWLPTPTFADEVVKGRAWAPRTRRFGYLFREIFGLYDSAEALTYVSDGGHYENLGLVELLRRRCTYVLCLDASGGPATLIEALQLAETELGVEVDVSYEALMEVRAAAAADGDTGPLAGRVAASDVLAARITYPAVTGIHVAPDRSTHLEEKTGWLIYGRAVLTEQTPPSVLDHAGGNLRFPNDPTGDQWFDADQFDSYLLLGRHVGRRMAAVLDVLAPLEADGVTGDDTDEVHV